MKEQIQEGAAGWSEVWEWLNMSAQKIKLKALFQTKIATCGHDQYINKL